MPKVIVVDSDVVTVREMPMGEFFVLDGVLLRTTDMFRTGNYWEEYKNSYPDMGNRLCINQNTGEAEAVGVDCSGYRVVVDEIVAKRI